MEGFTPDQLVGTGGVPFVIFLVEMTKRTFPSLRARWYPAMVAFWSVVLNVAIAYWGTHAALWWAVIVGLGAAKLAMVWFDAGKKGETPVAHG